IVVFNTPGANANAVKELVICGLLLASRKIVPSTEWIKTLKGKGDEVGKLVEKGKSQFTGPEIMGKKLGVIGLGAIGVLVANAAAALGMEVYGADPFLSVDNALKLSGKVRYVKSNKEIFENCDYISLHVPLMPETKGMINAESIAQMKKNVRLLNFSRDALVEEKAVLDALANGGMACYVTDFATDGLIGVENVIALPHLGASTPESEDNCAVMAVQEVADYIENGNIKNSVNLPNMEMAITGSAKICVIHKNVEGVINSITAPISAAGLNIENMQSKSKKEYAYTCLDISGDPTGIEAKLKEVANVVGVRVVK
ncbi:MAG: 3-phosphoglycerate dehydrogenase, partial [Oscillospiraceae bacterium]|nr:3-phosphoglycerate dehydrogenase [Oscillospiraceae bacterium]